MSLAGFQTRGGTTIDEITNAAKTIRISSSRAKRQDRKEQCRLETVRSNWPWMQLATTAYMLSSHFALELLSFLQKVR